MGNDAANRRFQGLLDNAWFNTMAAPDTTIMQLTCLPHDPAVTVTPATSEPTAAGTAVTYNLSVLNQNSAACVPQSFLMEVSTPQSDITAEPSFTSLPVISSGQTGTSTVTVTSNEDTEPGSYTIFFDILTNGSGGFPIGGIGGPVITPTTGPAFGAIARATVSAAGGAAPLPVAGSGSSSDGGSPSPTGFVQVQAQFVVAEPTGCHVSSARELTIRDVSVVDDPVRTTLDGSSSDPNTGAWSFGRLMQRLSPTDADAPDVTEAMLRSFLTRADHQ